MIGMYFMPYRPPSFDWRDLDNLLRHFPMEGAAHRPNWALAGGIAVMALLEAESVVGREVGPTCEDERSHKDLDVVVFDPSASRLTLEHPHEIYQSRNFRKPRRCVYHERDNPPIDFCFELLTDSFFGFPPPSMHDVVCMLHRGRRLWCLSPEYIIMSRLFSVAPIRQGVDDVDVAKLLRRFSVAPEHLAAIARGPVMPMIPREVLEAVVHGALSEQEILRALQPELRARFGDFWQEFPSTAWRSLLLFTSRSRLPRERLRALIDEERTTGHLRGADAIAFALLREATDFRTSTDLDLLREMSRKHSSSTMHILVSYAALVQDFLKYTRRAGWELDGVKTILGHEFVKTGYLHVYLARLNKTIVALRDLPKGDGYGALSILDELFTFLRQPRWMKMVGL